MPVPIIEIHDQISVHRQHAFMQVMILLPMFFHYASQFPQSNCSITAPVLISQ